MWCGVGNQNNIGTQKDRLYRRLISMLDFTSYIMYVQMFMIIDIITDKWVLRNRLISEINKCTSYCAEKAGYVNWLFCWRRRRDRTVEHNGTRTKPQLKRDHKIDRRVNLTYRLNVNACALPSSRQFSRTGNDAVAVVANHDQCAITYSLILRSGKTANVQHLRLWYELFVYMAGWKFDFYDQLCGSFIKDIFDTYIEKEKVDISLYSHMVSLLSIGIAITAYCKILEAPRHRSQRRDVSVRSTTV